MRGLDPRIHLKEESIEEDGLPGQARQRHSWQKIEGWAKARLRRAHRLRTKRRVVGTLPFCPPLQVR
jgi:hypothetical protein